MERNQRAWLSLTPEPERELPRAIATLRADGDPAGDAVEVERDRVERLVLRGRRRDWRRWLDETRELAARGMASHPREAQIALDVVDNHDALVLGLEPRRRGTNPR